MNLNNSSINSPTHNILVHNLAYFTEKTQPICLENVLKLLSDEYTCKLYDRHIQTLKKLCKSYQQGFFIKDAIVLFKIINIIIDRLEECPQLLDQLIEIVHICGISFLKEFTSDELTYAQIGTDCIEQLGYLMSIPNNTLKLEICKSILIIYEHHESSKTICQTYLPTSLAFNKKIIQNSDLAETIVKSLSFVDCKEFDIKMAILRLLASLSRDSECNCEKILRGECAKLLCGELFLKENCGKQKEILLVAVEILCNLLESSFDFIAVQQLNNYHCLRNISETFCQLINQGFSYLDRQLRNDILIVISLIASKCPQAPFTETGLAKNLVLLATFPEVKSCNILVKHLKLDNRIKENFEFKKLLFNILTLLSKNPEALQIYCDLKVLHALFCHMPYNSNNNSNNNSLSNFNQSNSIKNQCNNPVITNKNDDNNVINVKNKNSSPNKTNITKEDSNNIMKITTDKKNSHLYSFFNYSLQTKQLIVSQNMDTNNNNNQLLSSSQLNFNKNRNSNQSNFHNSIHNSQLNLSFPNISNHINCDKQLKLTADCYANQSNLSKLNHNNQSFNNICNYSNNNSAIFCEWTSEQIEEMRFIALTVMSHIAPLLTNQLLEIRGPDKILLFLDWCLTDNDGYGEFGNSFYSKKFSRGTKLTHLEKCIDIIKKILIHPTCSQQVMDEFLVNGLIERIICLLSLYTRNSNCIDEDIIKDKTIICIISNLLEILNQLCQKDISHKKLLGKSGVEVVVKILKIDPDLLKAQLGHYSLLFLAISLTWSVIVGETINEEYFLEVGGLFNLLDLLESSPLSLQTQLLGVISDLMQISRCVPHFLTWRAHQKTEYFNKYFITNNDKDIIHNYNNNKFNKYNKKDTEKGIDNEYYSSNIDNEINNKNNYNISEDKNILNEIIANNINNYGNNIINSTSFDKLKDFNVINKNDNKNITNNNNNSNDNKRSNKMIVSAPRLLCELWRQEEARLGVVRDKYGKIVDKENPLATKLQWTNPLIIQDSTSPSHSIIECSESSRANIYSIFSKIGFSDLPGLEKQDLITMKIIEHYIDLKSCEVWKEIFDELALENVRPLTPDQEMLDIIDDVICQKREAVISQQQCIQIELIDEELYQESALYNKIKEESMKEAKIRRKIEEFVERTSNHRALVEAKKQQMQSISNSRLVTNVPVLKVMFESEMNKLNVTTYCSRNIQAENMENYLVHTI